MPGEQQSPSAPSALQTFAIPISIVIAGALIALAVFASSSSAPGGGSGAPEADIKKVKITENDPYIGKKDAKVTMVYWFDYQCPFCKAFEVGGVEGIAIEPSMPMLKKDYIDTGKLRIVFKDYPFLGEDSLTAALYSHAIWESYPDKWYEWHEAMFHSQDEEQDIGFGDEASILALIKKVRGLDAGALQAKVAEKKDAYSKLISEDQAEGASFGISGTPGFITGKQLISGADAPATFKAAVESQL